MKDIIAIDGPSASGKGTISNLLSQKFNIPYLNTGSLYRAVAFDMMSNSIDCNENNLEPIYNIAENLSIDSLSNKALKNEEVGSVASQIASIPKIREILFDFQRDFCLNSNGGVIEGRDIGTVIYPEARYKFFVFASLQERANRRFKELSEGGSDVSYEDIYKKLQERDIRDSSRSNAPLLKANDAVEIDTTNTPIEEVFKIVLNFIDKK